MISKRIIVKYCESVFTTFFNISNFCNFSREIEVENSKVMQIIRVFAILFCVLKIRDFSREIEVDNSQVVLNRHVFTIFLVF